jgi:hypothetical protein
VVQSSEAGTAYLVVSTATVTSLADILVLADSQYNSVAIATANTATNLPLTGLSSGAYKLYTVDAAGNLSAATSNTISVSAPVNLSAIAAGSGGFVINGAAANDYSGYGVSNAGDVNGDGLADVIVGTGQTAASFSVGKSYVVFGRTGTTAAIDLSAVAAGTGGFSINGPAGENGGYSVSNAGDVNGDGLADLLVGSPVTSGGKSYVVFGKTDTTAINLTAVAGGIGGFVISGQGSDGSNLGNAVSAAGDVNGDGLSDLLIGANGGSKNYIVFGKTDTGAINLSAVAAGTGGMVINGPSGTGGNLRGLTISTAGDVNGDGLSDVIVVGVDNFGSGLDRVYVAFGRTSGPVNLSAVASGVGGFLIQGSINGTTTFSNAGDVNGDGLADVIVKGIDGASTSYVVFGKTTTTTVDLASIGSVFYTNLLAH